MDIVDPRYNEADLALMWRLKEDIPYSMERLLRVEDRDSKGRMVPMKLKPAQLKLDTLIARIQALNITLGLLDHPKLSKIQEAHPDITLDPKGAFRATLDAIQTANPNTFLRLTHQAVALDPPLSDGPVQTVVGKCRRGGISAYVQGRLCLESNFNRGVRGNVMAHKGKNTELIFSYNRNFYVHWPAVDRGFRTKQESASKDASKWANGSRVSIQSAMGKEGGRSDQADFYHFSECAFFPSYDEVSNTLAAKPGHAWIFEESTANGPSGGYYSRWRDALDIETVITAYEEHRPDVFDRWNGFIRFFFSWLEEPAYQAKVYDWERTHFESTLTETERALRDGLGATLEQLKWRRWKIREIAKDAGGLDPEEFFMQEFPATPEEMFQASGSKHFNQKKLTAMQDRNKHAVANAYLRFSDDGIPITSSRGLANLVVWAPPKPGHRYVVGGDVAKGLSTGDYSVAFVLDRCDGTYAREAAVWRGKIEPEAFGDVITMLAMLYNNAFVVVEVNDQGYTTNKRIHENRYPFILHRASPDRVKDRKDDTNTWQWGWFNNAATRNIVLGEMQGALSNDLIEIMSPQVLHELKAFENIDGKLQAPPGDYDDCVFASCLAFWGHTSAAPKFTPREVRQDAAQERELGAKDQWFWEQVQEMIVSQEKRDKKAGRLPVGYMPREWKI